MVEKIFISYRRDDSKQFTQLLINELQKYYDHESFFRDVESIHGGTNFQRAIAQALHLTKICLVVIGDKWLTVTDLDGNRRIENEEDFVHYEVATALADKEIAVLPVLINGTRMPNADQLPSGLKSLANLQGIRIFDDRIETDIQYLVKDMAKFQAPKRNWPLGGGSSYANQQTNYSNAGTNNGRTNAGNTGGSGVIKPAKPDNYLVWAILATILCCLVTGIIAIVNSSKVDGYYISGQYDLAEKASKAAKQWSIYSIVAGVVVAIIYIILLYVVGMGDLGYTGY